MLSSFVSLALLGFGNPQLSKQNFRIPAWNIRIERDRFTGAIKCAIYQGSRRWNDLSYRHGAVAFDFPKHVNTTGADIRLNDGSAQPWSSFYPAVVATGAQLASGSLDNPTNGEVILPLSTLRGVYSVTIRPTAQSKPRRFSVAGLQDAIASARSLGCDAELGAGK